MTLNTGIIGKQRNPFETDSQCSYLWDVSHVRCLVHDNAHTLHSARSPFGVNVVVHRMAAVTRWPGCRCMLSGYSRIVGGLPVRAGIRNVGTSYIFSANVPLGRKRIVVIANFGEVSLLPDAAVDERNPIGRELALRCSP